MTVLEEDVRPDNRGEEREEPSEERPSHPSDLAPKFADVGFDPSKVGGVLVDLQLDAREGISVLETLLGQLLSRHHGHDRTVSLCLRRNKTRSARKWKFFGEVV